MQSHKRCECISSEVEDIKRAVVVLKAARYRSLKSRRQCPTKLRQLRQSGSPLLFKQSNDMCSVSIQQEDIGMWICYVDYLEWPFHCVPQAFELHYESLQLPLETAISIPISFSRSISAALSSSISWSHIRKRTNFKGASDLIFTSL